MSALRNKLLKKEIQIERESRVKLTFLNIFIISRKSIFENKNINIVIVNNKTRTCFIKFMFFLFILFQYVWGYHKFQLIPSYFKIVFNRFFIVFMFNE